MIEPAQRIVIKILRPRRRRQLVVAVIAIDRRSRRSEIAAPVIAKRRGPRRRQLVEAVGGIAAEVYITPTSSVSTIAILTQPYLRKI
jgi:hypothetical protein